MRFAIPIALAGALLAAPLAAQEAPPPLITVAIDESSPDPIITFYRIESGIAEPAEREPRMKVYADGRVWVQYPVYMKKAGEYEMQLSPAELDALIATMTDSGLLTVEDKSLKAEVKSEEAAAAASKTAPQLTYRSEETITAIVFDFESATIAGQKSAIAPFEKTFDYYGLETDAKAHEEIESLRKAKDGVAALLALTTDEDLRKVAAK